jgi:hypothetical protein
VIPDGPQRLATLPPVSYKRGVQTTVPYVLERRAGVVELWSLTRLQFQPKGWQIQMRRELRGALASLAGDQIAALYASPVLDACDTENILFYNVGMAAFRMLSEGRLRFERGFDPPAAPAALPEPLLHYHRYRAGAEINGEFELWPERESLATFDDVELPQLRETTKPAVIWWALRHSNLEIPRRPAYGGYFGTRITVRTASAVTAAQVIKPLLDGVVSALHTYVGTQLKVVADRLAEQLAVRSVDIAGALVETGTAVLGERALVVPRATGVQWFPADDRCDACEVRVERDLSATRATVSGAVFAVEASGPASA